MVRCAIPFMLGVAIALSWRVPLPVTGGLFLLLTIAAVIAIMAPGRPEGRWKRGLVVSWWFLSAGTWWCAVHEPLNDPRHYSRVPTNEGTWAVRISAVNGRSDRSLRADAELVARISDDTTETVHGTIMLTLLPDTGGHLPSLGDRILIAAPLTPIDRTPDPGGFNRKGWAASRGIQREAFVPGDAWRAIDHSWHWSDGFSRMREGVADWLAGSGLPKAERSLVKALVLGQRDELDGDQKEAFARSGTIHVLAVSGMHVGIIFGILSLLFGWWGGSTGARVARGVFILLALWGYAGLAGGSPSILRATIMFSLFTWAGMMEQRTDHLNSLFAAAFLLLLWEPRMLGQLGFQLSFLAVLGIILFYRPVERLWLPEGRIPRLVWSLAVVSISAQLLVTPVSLYLFKAFPVWFLPANIIVVSAVGLAVQGAVAMLLLYKVPLLGELLTWGLSMLLQGVGSFTRFIADLPLAYPAVRIGIPEVVLLYLIILGIAAWTQWRWRSMRWMTGVSMVIFLASWGLRAREGREVGSLVIYDDHKRSVVTMSLGRSLTVLGSQEEHVKDPRMRRQIEGHKRAKGLRDVAFLDIHAVRPGQVIEHAGTVYAPGRWRSPLFDFGFVSDAAPLPVDTVDRMDAILIGNIDHLDRSTFPLLAASCGILVLSPDLRWGLRNAIRSWCLEHGVPFHDIRQHGAFVLERRSKQA